MAILKGLSDAESHALLYDWRFWARPKQFAPKGDWGVWIIRAGRGFGKTRAGAGWVHERAIAYPRRWIALIARTPADARDFMIEGPGGIAKNTAPWERPLYEPSKRRLTWPNGSWATIYSDEEPDQLRGYSGDTAWLDEFAKFKNPRECWDNLQFGMREASDDRPRCLITTTPRSIPILKEIEAMSTTIVVRGSSYENRKNLDPTWFTETISKYEGTRLGRQEINAEILDDVPGALWTLDMIDRLRIPAPTGEMSLARVVVGVDPAATSKDESDETGIIIAGRGIDGEAYILADYSCKLSPRGWGRRAVDGYHRYRADRIIGETNNGGDMIEAVIRIEDQNVSYKKVTASRGKATRAEPIAALYEQGRVHHVGLFPELENQLCMFTRNGYMGEDSPDRADALVWALTELMLEEHEMRIRFL